MSRFLDHLRRRPNRVFLYGLAFFLVGGAVVYVLVKDDAPEQCREAGGVPVRSAEQEGFFLWSTDRTVCLNPSAVLEVSDV